MLTLDCVNPVNPLSPSGNSYTDEFLGQCIVMHPRFSFLAGG